MTASPHRHDHHAELSEWSDRLEAVITSTRLFTRVTVVAETASTQDSARRMSAGSPGLVVTAGRQTAGRGRLGRAWADTSHLGIAATFVVPRAMRPAPLLAAGAGLAMCATAEDALGCTGALGLKWPNDLIEAGGSRRKVGGVLIEADDQVALVGIGVNVLQEKGDFPLELRPRAASLAMLGASTSRIDVLCRLTAHLDSWLAASENDLEAAWARREALRGHRQSFLCPGVTIEGVVESVDVLRGLRVRTDDGRLVELDALTTSVVKE